MSMSASILALSWRISLSCSYRTHLIQPSLSLASSEAITTLACTVRMSSSSFLSEAAVRIWVSLVADAALAMARSSALVALRLSVLIKSCTSAAGLFALGSETMAGEMPIARARVMTWSCGKLVRIQAEVTMSKIGDEAGDDEVEDGTKGRGGKRKRERKGKKRRKKARGERKRSERKGNSPGAASQGSGRMDGELEWSASVSKRTNW